MQLPVCLPTQEKVSCSRTGELHRNVTLCCPSPTGSRYQLRRSLRGDIGLLLWFCSRAKPITFLILKRKGSLCFWQMRASSCSHSHILTNLVRSALNSSCPCVCAASGRLWCCALCLPPHTAEGADGEACALFPSTDSRSRSQLFHNVVEQRNPACGSQGSPGGSSATSGLLKLFRTWRHEAGLPRGSALSSVSCGCLPVPGPWLFSGDCGLGDSSARCVRPRHPGEG